MLQVMHPPQKFVLNHFKMGEDRGLKIIALSSPTMASPAYPIS
jgi:hypothetical protein